jgi:hypothetical protein
MFRSLIVDGEHVGRNDVGSPLPGEREQVGVPQGRRFRTRRKYLVVTVSAWTRV